ncbi:MAG: RBBP9/YdeN family alpha/beta hydrolase [Capsulimonadaceae bacterium]
MSVTPDSHVEQDVRLREMIPGTNVETGVQTEALGRSAIAGRVFLIVHGTGGNSPAHWEEYLAAELRTAGFDVRAPQFPDADTPELEAWIARLEQELSTIQPDAHLTVLAHSRGCILWLHYAARAITACRFTVAERVLLVAPPYFVEEDQPSGFFPPPLLPDGIAAVGLETAIIASDDDEYATYSEVDSCASALRIPIYCLSGAGHISPFYGYGEWPWVRDWCLFRAVLPPKPNTTS